METKDEFDYPSWEEMHPPRRKGKRLDALAAFSAPTDYWQHWDPVLDAVGRLDGLPALQAQLDSAVKAAGLTYNHAWFSWELLRRSASHWNRHAWWLRSGESLSPSQRAIRDRLKRATEKWEAEADWYESLGQCVDEFFRQFVPAPHTCPQIGPTHRFPTPEADGSCPRGHESLETLLWTLLSPACAVPLTLLTAGDRQDAASRSATSRARRACFLSRQRWPRARPADGVSTRRIRVGPAAHRPRPFGAPISEVRRRLARIQMAAGHQRQHDGRSAHRVSVVIDLNAHDDAILEAVHSLRANRSVPLPKKGLRGRKVWGVKLTATQVIELLEHVEDGGSAETWGSLAGRAEQLHLAAQSQGDDYPVDSTEAMSLARKAHRTLERVLDALERAPLRAIAPLALSQRVQSQ